MDESLRYPYRVPVHAPAKVHSAPRARTKHERAWRLPHLTLPNFLERRSRLQPVVFLTVALSLTSAGVLGTMYGPGYRVSVDGVDLGLVGSPKAVAAAAERVEDRASDILGYDYTLDQSITHSFEVCLHEDVEPISKVETYLFDQIGEVMKTSVLTVKGQMIGAADDDAALTAMLEGIKAPYINENTVSAEFVEPLTVSREYTATTAIRSIDSMQAVLTSNSLEQVDYTVQAGDTFSAIANSHGMRVAELQLLNPDVNIDRLQIGQTLTISQAVPFLSVRTVDNVTYDGPVAFEVEEVTDDTMYQGNKKVLTPGVEGWATYNADVTSINGQETERVINSTQVHTQPVTQVVAHLRQDHLGLRQPVYLRLLLLPLGHRHQRLLRPAHRRRRRRQGHLRRHGHGQLLELRQLCGGRPRERPADHLRPLLQPERPGGRPGLQGPDHRPGGLHRPVHRQPLPLPGEGERHHREPL